MLTSCTSRREVYKHSPAVGETVFTFGDNKPARTEIANITREIIAEIDHDPESTFLLTEE
jgi:hypothetical protein